MACFAKKNGILEFMKQVKMMKHFKVLLTFALIAGVASPNLAYAKKKRSSSGQTMSSAERAKAIDWCRKKYPGPYTWRVEYGIYSGKKQWWCVPSY